MEFKFNCEQLLNSDTDGIAILLAETQFNNNQKQNINLILDVMGSASAKVILIIY